MVPDQGHDRRWLRPLVSLVVGLLLLGYAAWKMDVRAFANAMLGIHAPAYLATMFCFVVLILVTDTIATASVYRSYVCPVRFREILTLRGAAYLPALVNYHVGQLWLTWFVSKAYRAPIGRVAGVTLLIYATIFGGICGLSAASWLIARESLPWLGPVLLAVGAAALGYLAVLALRPRFVAKIPGVGLLLEVGIAGHLRALAFRVPHVVMLFLAMWLPYRFFGIEIPFLQALALMPPLMLVGALPLTPQGVGTRELLAVQLLGPFVEGSTAHRAALITAATFSWATALTLSECLISPFMMRSAQRLLDNDRARGEGAPDLGDVVPK